VLQINKRDVSTLLNLTRAEKRQVSKFFVFKANRSTPMASAMATRQKDQPVTQQRQALNREAPARPLHRGIKPRPEQVRQT